MKDHDPKALYEQQLTRHRETLVLLQKKRSRLGWIRFALFLGMVAAAWYVFTSFGLWGILPVVIGIGSLLYAVSLDVNNNSSISNCQRLIGINEEELAILNHRFAERFSGQDFTPPLHDYAADLDLFGKHSLFQWMNRCESVQGRALLARNLLTPLLPKDISERQEAVKELAPLLEWRQQLQAYAKENTLTDSAEKRTMQWLAGEEEHYGKSWWGAVVNIYAVLAVGSGIAALLGYFPSSLFSGVYLLLFLTSLFLSRNTVKPYLHLSGIVKEISTLYQMVSWIESKEFHSPRLKQLKENCHTENDSAAREIRELKSILDRFDMRLNIAGLLFFNPFLLWDVRQMIALNRWRRKNGVYVPAWFALIAEVEVLGSLAAIHFNQPHWVFPQAASEHFTLSVTGCGHPLIPEPQRVDNDFSLAGKGKIALVTGSNMAGKSTFLRSLGINIILAQLGAPVCAREMKWSPVHLMTSMRIADNLSENTSTFYAELKKLKTIIEAVERKENVFILLDEILRGTNSYDRHTGSKALIKQFILHDAVAVIATHDVELAQIEKEFPAALENYHFDVQVEGEELYFDYRLKHGVCTSLNASILMKKIGIEL